MNRRTLNIALSIIGSLITIFVFISGFDSISSIFKEKKGKRKVQQEIIRPSDLFKSDSTIEVSIQKKEFFTNIWIVTEHYKYIISKELWYGGVKGNISEACLSPDNSKICYIKTYYGGDNELIIMNIDSTNIRRYYLTASKKSKIFGKLQMSTEIKNITWLLDTRIRFFINVSDGYIFLRLEQFDLDGRGDYKINLDDYNNIVDISKYH